jgi:hypothetical protein
LASSFVLVTLLIGAFLPTAFHSEDWVAKASIYFRAASIAQTTGMVVDILKCPSGYFGALEFKVGAVHQSVNRVGGP